MASILTVDIDESLAVAETIDRRSCQRFFDGERARERLPMIRSRESAEYQLTVQALNRFTWLLPAAVGVFAVYLALAIIGGVKLGWPIWLILVGSFPAVGITWIAMVVALLDASKRPKAQISDEARIVWLLSLCIFNVVALLPYWLIVVRRNPEIAA